jgi:hypothetical protein
MTCTVRTICGVLVSLIALAPVQSSASPITSLGFSSVSFHQEGGPSIDIVDPNLELAQEVLNMINNVLHIQPEPGAVLPLLSVTWHETASQARFSVSGGPLSTAHGGLNAGKLSIANQYWEWDPVLSFQNPNILFRDLASLSGTIVHFKGPDAGDGLGGSATVTLRFPLSVLGDDPLVSIEPNPTIHPNEHYDVFQGRAAGTRTGTTLSNWTLALDADHIPEPIPEPSTLLLFGSSLAGLGGFAWRRQRRNSRLPTTED